MKKVFFAFFTALITPVSGLAAVSDGDSGSSLFMQEEKAVEAAKAAGYSPTVLEAYQNGTIFFIATKNGASYEVKVTPNGQVTPVTSPSPGRDPN